MGYKLKTHIYHGELKTTKELKDIAFKLTGLPPECLAVRLASSNWTVERAVETGYKEIYGGTPATKYAFRNTEMTLKEIYDILKPPMRLSAMRNRLASKSFKGKSIEEIMLTPEKYSTKNKAINISSKYKISKKYSDQSFNALINKINSKHTQTLHLSIDPTRSYIESDEKIPILDLLIALLEEKNVLIREEYKSKYDSIQNIKNNFQKKLWANKFETWDFLNHQDDMESEYFRDNKLIPIYRKTLYVNSDCSMAVAFLLEDEHDNIFFQIVDATGGQPQSRCELLNVFSIDRIDAFIEKCKQYEALQNED